MSNLPQGLNFLVHLRLALSFAKDCKSEDPLERLEYGITKTIDHHLKLSENRERRENHPSLGWLYLDDVTSR